VSPGVADVTRGTNTKRARGRRRGATETRAEILQAARQSFAARGFSGTTVRYVASQAGVDPALVHHYFGSKDDLFLAALELPVDPREVLPGVLAGGLHGLAERLLGTVLSLWDDPAVQLSLVAMLRDGLSPGASSKLLQEGLLRIVLAPIAERLPAAERERRVQLFATQMIGLLVGRYVLALEPLASIPREELVAWVAPNLQRYLTGPLPG
jgi:AcrR family transcriptional regulator